MARTHYIFALCLKSNGVKVYHMRPCHLAQATFLDSFSSTYPKLPPASALDFLLFPKRPFHDPCKRQKQEGVAEGLWALESPQNHVQILALALPG